MASQRRRAARPRAVRALVTSVIVGGSLEKRGTEARPCCMGTSGPHFSTLLQIRIPTQLPASCGRLLLPIIRVGQFSPLMLTIHCDQHTAAVRRRVHPVVSNAFVFPGLASLDVGDF